MKTILLTCLATIVLSTICLAQDDISGDETPTKRFSFGFSAGNGYPMGEYGGISPSKLPMSKVTGQDTNHISGYAKPGFHFDIHAACRITGHLGIMVSYTGDQNGYDINSLNAQYDGAYPPNTVSIFTSQRYYIWQFLIGPQFNFSISDECSIEFDALAGITHINNPELTIIGLQDTVTYTYSIGSGFGYSVEGGIKYTVPTDGALGLAFHLNAGYKGAFIRYQNYSTLMSNTTATNAYLYNYSKYMNIGLIEISVGISLEF